MVLIEGSRQRWKRGLSVANRCFSFSLSLSLSLAPLALFLSLSLSGAILGYIGVSAGALGVPFVHPIFFYQNPRFSPAVMGSAVYGGMGLAMAALGGKKF